MRSLEELDRWIGGKVKAWTSRVGASQGRELLEVRRDILENVRDHIQFIGGGKCAFPYGAVSVSVAIQNEGDRDIVQAGLASLPADIRAFLEEAGCPLGNLTINADLIDDTTLAWGDKPFRIDYATTPAKPKSIERPAARLTVLTGESDSTEHRIDSNRVNLGRLKEVHGEKHGLRRRNDIAFADTESSVSREHANLRWDPDSAKFRVFDDGSARGTSIYREGRRIEVPRSAQRGVQLQDGDEIQIGDARLKFELIR